MTTAANTNTLSSAVMLRADNVMQTANFKQTTFAEVAAMAASPLSVPKDKAPVFHPSTSKAKTKYAILDADSMSCLVADLDSGDLDLSRIEEQLQSAGLAQWLVYATASSKPEGRRWRILAPLVEPVDCEQWTDLQRAFGGWFEVADECANRLTQVSFLPNRGEHYEHSVKHGAPLDTTDTAHPLVKAALVELEKRKQAELDRELDATTAPCKAGALYEGQISPIDAYNEHYQITGLLQQYGYKRRGDKWLHPNSASGSPGVVLLGGRYFSHHGCDPLADGHTHDAFDLFTRWEHYGNFDAALKAAGEMLTTDGISITQHNQRVYMATQSGANATDVDGQPPAQQKPVAEVLDEQMAMLRQDPENENAFELIIACLASTAIKPLKKKAVTVELTKLTPLSQSEIKKAVAEANKEAPLTHSELAATQLQRMAGEHAVAVDGALWLYDAKTGIYRKLELLTLAAQIGKNFVGEPRCARGNEYRQIASLVYAHARKDDFFSGAVRGICTPTAFYALDGQTVVKRAHSHENRQRFAVPVEPEERQPELFLDMLRSAFGDTYSDQVMVVQQMLGAALFGIQQGYQKAVFLHGAGGSGKSTLLEIIQALFDSQAVASVSPLDMDSDYNKATLAGKRLNAVPELDKDKPIPAAEFKSVLGGDTMSGRVPYGMPFTFKCEAGQWFNGNYFPTTTDTSDGFFRRWLIVDFRHAKPQHERDLNLAKNIIRDELGAILGWAITGVADLLNNGLYESETHKTLLAKWRTESNSVLSWLEDEPSESGVRKDDKGLLKPVNALNAYSLWCSTSKRKPMGRNRFYRELEAAGYPIRRQKGERVIRGLKAAFHFD